MDTSQFREIYFGFNGYYILFQKLVYETIIYYYNVSYTVYYYYKSDSDSFIVRRSPTLYYTTALTWQILNHPIRRVRELMGRFHIRFENPTALLLKWSLVKCSFQRWTVSNVSFDFGTQTVCIIAHIMDVFDVFQPLLR